jgi:tetratricopeptide (TPR) repeat protein
VFSVPTDRKPVVWGRRTADPANASDPAHPSDPAHAFDPTRPSDPTNWDLCGIQPALAAAEPMMFMQQPEADRLVQAATAELAQFRTIQAANLLEAALRVDPRHAMALTKQAELALLRRDPERALTLTDTALAIEPHFAPAWHQRASACWLTGSKPAAVQAARRAVDIQPPNPGFRLRLAQFAAWTGHGAETRSVLAPLLAGQRHDPVHYAAALSMLGELAIAEGRFDEALNWLDQALELQPGLHVTRMLRGMNRLRLGQYQAGWTDYAAREAVRELYPDGACPGGAPSPPGQGPVDQPLAGQSLAGQSLAGQSLAGQSLADQSLADQSLADQVWQGQVWQGQVWQGQVWQGQSLAGKTLLVTDDQGHGDAIQFFRYLPLLRDRAEHVTWCTFPPLVRLFAAAAPDATVLGTLPEGARFDVRCHSTNLPRWFDTALDSIPAAVAYRPATSDPPIEMRPTGMWPAVMPATSTPPTVTPSGSRRKRLRPQPAGPQVGLAWSGDVRHTRDHLRSIPAALFLALADLPGISVHSLQHAVRAADLPALQARPAIGRAVETATDFADTAALIERIDLVITVDTAVAHLAASMGKPVWVVLHVAADWRWLTDRSDSPWYPSVRLFRVRPAEWRGDAGPPAAADWHPVLHRVETALRIFAAGWPAGG